METIIAHRTFADVILPPRTRAALDEALSLVHSHELIFSQWGLGEKHSSGLGLAFNFAGPPGTGKTICAEAIATATVETIDTLSIEPELPDAILKHNAAGVLGLG